jgi:transposase
MTHKVDDKRVHRVYLKTGGSISRTAALLGISESAAYRRLRRVGYTPSGQRGMPRKLPPTIAEGYRAGMSMNQIAEKYGASLATVAEALRRAGVSSRRKGGVWKGGCVQTADGYRMVYVLPSDPMAVMRGRRLYVMEHRLVMARHLGRPLERHETVHHINGNRADNRIENLQLRRGHHGNGVVHRCRACGSTDIESQRLN